MQCLCFEYQKNGTSLFYNVMCGLRHTFGFDFTSPSFPQQTPCLALLHPPIAVTICIAVRQVHQGQTCRIGEHSRTLLGFQVSLPPHVPIMMRLE